MKKILTMNFRYFFYTAINTTYDDESIKKKKYESCILNK